MFEQEYALLKLFEKANDLKGERNCKRLFISYRWRVCPFVWISSTITMALLSEYSPILMY